MRVLGVVIGGIVVAVLGYVAWTYGGVEKEVRDATLEARARMAIDELRDRVVDLNDRRRQQEVAALLAADQVARLERERAEYEKAARDLGRIGREAEIAGSGEPVRYEGREYRPAEARDYVVLWAREARLRQSGIEVYSASRQQAESTAARIQSLRIDLTGRISELEARLARMAAARDQAEALRFATELDDAASGAVTAKDQRVFAEIEEAARRAEAEAKVLERELGADPLKPGPSRFGNDAAILGEYWR